MSTKKELQVQIDTLVLTLEKERNANTFKQEAQLAMIERLKKDFMMMKESANTAGQQAYANAHYKELYEDLKEEQCLDALEEELKYHKAKSSALNDVMKLREDDIKGVELENVNLMQALQKTTDQLRKTQTAHLNVSLKLI